MANNITIHLLGGQPKVVTADTVQDAFNQSGLPVGNYTAQVNGETAQMSDKLNDYEHVSFATATKGGAKKSKAKTAKKKAKSSK
jgi:hypothetical protein